MRILGLSIANIRVIAPFSPIARRARTQSDPFGFVVHESTTKRARLAMSSDTSAYPSHSMMTVF
jgi:hypothetical protein